MSQLALPLKLQDHAVFESFWPAGNDTLLAFLGELAETGNGRGCWIWGAAATGKTHLLQAVCARRGNQVPYVPLALLHDSGPGILDGLSSRQFVCIDDVDKVAGDASWERALFNLVNELSEAGGVIVVSATASARESGIRLADLASRFSMLPAFHLAPLDDENRIRALQLRARHRGLDLPDDTATYLLKRCRRDMATLYSLLDRLDSAALAAKRRLTIRFVRDTLSRLDR